MTLAPLTRGTKTQGATTQSCGMPESRAKATRSCCQFEAHASRCLKSETGDDGYVISHSNADLLLMLTATASQYPCGPLDYNRSHDATGPGRQ